ncbi:MAG: glycosyltransferase family 4 protein [Acidobacteriota bacterium]|nr:glycosyltransferase family 4 protein [Acidobacteriota bacterium]
MFEQEGFTCFHMAGQLDQPNERSFLVPKADFRHPDIVAIYQGCFWGRKRDPITTGKLHELRYELKKAIYSFIERFSLDILVVENALAIPLNVPLGLSLTEVISETGIPTIAHHHDFFWERQRFLTNVAWEYLNMAFPPNLPQVRHVVINSAADHQLGLRTGISATVIPNVMDFAHPPPPVDEYTTDVREALGVAADELFVLQPTRVVPRKGIEHAIELMRRLETGSRLVISHASGDEGFDYEKRLMSYASLMQVNTAFVSEIIGGQRGRTPSGAKIYALDDIYPHADLVTYPSTFEGFGNAFLEAIYFRKPIVINAYSIYQTDIRPKGFQAIEMDGYITEDTVAQTRKVLGDPLLRQEMTERNYELGRKHYSYEVLQTRLKALIADQMLR